MKETMDMLGSFTDERVQSSTVMRKGNQAVFLPHQRSFAGLNNWLSRTYRFTFDEALKRDYNSAKAMLNDAFIQGLLRNRILPTCKSPWRIKASGPGASQEIEHFYESALKQIPLWHDFRRNLLMSVWHGRYGIQVAYDSISHDYREFTYEGRPVNTVSHWIPHSGDKITFTWDGVPGIRINPMFVGSWQQRYGATVLQPGDERLAPESYQYRWTEEGPIMLLDTPEVRRKFIVPVFEVTDAPWDEPDMAGGVRGVGLRHYAFWAWDQRQEVVSWAMLHLEDFGAGGYTIVAYDGKEALARNIEAFKDPERRVIHIPVIPGNDERVTDMVTRLTPAGEGNDAIFQWAESYFNAHLTILFTGHPLNSQAAPTGMGSEMAGKSTEILKSIQRSDAEVSDCAITQELLPELVKRNDKGAKYQLEFVSSVRDADKQQRIDAAKKHYDMGGKVPTRYSHMLAEVPEPEDGEECLQNPSMQQQQVDPITGQPIQQQQPPDGGAVQAMKQKGGKHADKIGDIFRRSRQVTLDDARQALQQAGVPDESIMATIAFGVRTAAVIELDTEGGVTYERGPGAWPELAGSEGNTVAAYSMDADPGSKWEAIEAPIKGGTRWRNIETGTITYVQPSAGRAVQALPGSTEHPGRTIERGEAGRGVALLPGKGLATGGVEQRVEMLAGGSVRDEAHVLEEVRNVDRRLLKKQTVALAGRLGLGVSSRTSKTEAMAYIEDKLRSRIGAKEEKPKAGNAKQHIEEGIKAGKLSPEAGKAATQALEQHGKGKAIQEHFTEGVKAGKLQPEEAKVAIEAASNASKPAGETIDQGDKATSNKEAMALPTGTDGATQGASPADSKHHEMIDSTLSKSGLNDETKKKYSEAAKSVHSKLPDEAKARIEKNVKGVNFHESSEALTKELVNKSSSIKGKLGGKKANGAFSKKTGELHLDGGDNINGQKSTHEEIYAHEYAHAIDGPDHELSGHQDWHAAWKAEAEGVSKYATKTPQEGFAEFGRMVYSSGMTADQIKEKFPMMHQYWESNKLIPQEAAGGSKGQQVEKLQEIFSEPFDSKDIIGDTPAIAVQDKNAPRADGETLKGYLKRIGKDEHHDSLKQYARSKHRQEREDHDYHNSAIKQALEGLAYEQGTKKFNMTQARKTGDFTTIKGFDTVARSVAMNHPGLFAGMDAGKNYEGEETGLSQDHQQKLWDMLTEGKKQYRTLREHEDEAIAEHHEAGWPTIEKDEADPRRAKGEAIEEPGEADTSFDFGANTEEKQADKFAPGAVHEIEPRGNMYGFKAKFFESNKEGHIGVGYHDGDQPHTSMPVESAKHFVNDLQGKVDLTPNSGHEVIDTIAGGKGEWLGKGNDGVLFKVGDKVAKMSTTVPFQPFNPGHRTPEEAKQHIEKGVKVNNKLMELGVPGLLKNEYVEHEDKAFAIRDHLEMPEKLTEEQMQAVRHTMDRMHEEGYVLGDEVQVGIKDGKPYLFDLGNAQKARDERDYEDDSNRFQRFSKKHGHEELPLHKEAKAGVESSDRARELYGEKVPKFQLEYEDRMRRGLEASQKAKELHSPPRGGNEGSGFMEQEQPGKYAPEHMEELKGQSFTNDKGLTVDLRKEEDGTWSVGSQKGLTQAGAAKALNKMGAEKAKGLFGDEVTAQADKEKPKQKLEWAEPTKRKDDGAELPGMRDTFAPGMFGRAATEAETEKAAKPELPKDAVDAFELNVIGRLRDQVNKLDDVHNTAGARYAWEAATKKGEKPGDPHAGSKSLELWKEIAAENGVDADQYIAEHPEYNELVERLDKHRGWGDEGEYQPRPTEAKAEQPGFDAEGNVATGDKAIYKSGKEYLSAKAKEDHENAREALNKALNDTRTHEERVNKVSGKWYADQIGGGTYPTAFSTKKEAIEHLKKTDDFVLESRNERVKETKQTLDSYTEGKKESTYEERKQQKASDFIDNAVEKVHQRALKETGEVNHRRLEYLADSHWLNTADNQHDYLDSKEYKQKVVDAVAAKMGIERPTAETLDDHGLYREFNGRHQYKFSNDSGWKTANSKEDAIEQATSTYYGMTKSERKTKAQRAQEADDQLYKRLDATHGNMTKEQLDARIDELKGIAGATRADEFNGMGGRSSRKAMANEAARDAGQEALQLNIYREMKHGKREEAPQASEPQAPQEAPIEQAPPRGGIDHEEVGRKLRGATKEEAIGILKGVMEEHGVNELPTSALQLISRAGGGYGTVSRSGTPNAKPEGGHWRKHDAQPSTAPDDAVVAKKRNPKANTVEDDEEATRIADELYSQHKERLKEYEKIADAFDRMEAHQSSYQQYENELKARGIVPSIGGKFGYKNKKGSTHTRESFDEDKHPRDEDGKFASKGGEGEKGEKYIPSKTNDAIKTMAKDIHGSGVEKQPRAKAGGEIGPNGLWYSGGAFIATSDMPKQERMKIEKAGKSSGKVKVDGNTWEVPQVGKMSLLDKLGGTIMDPRTGVVNYQYLDYQRYTDDEKKTFEELAGKWKAGEKWVDIREYPILANFTDIARMVVNGEAVPEAALNKMPEKVRQYFVKYTA